MKKLIIASFLMCVLGVVAYANDCSKIVNDECWQIASSAVNWDESQHGCLSQTDWHIAYCGYYNNCISQ